MEGHLQLGVRFHQFLHVGVAVLLFDAQLLPLLLKAAHSLLHKYFCRKNAGHVQLQFVHAQEGRRLVYHLQLAGVVLSQHCVHSGVNDVLHLAAVHSRRLRNSVVYFDQQLLDGDESEGTDDLRVDGDDFHLLFACLFETDVAEELVLNEERNGFEHLFGVDEHLKDGRFGLVDELNQDGRVEGLSTEEECRGEA